MVTAPGLGPRPSPAPAQRARPPGWRDPRLWVGVLVLAGSVVLGARVLGAADDTVQVWAAASDLGAGDELDAADLVATRVRFADPADLGRYVGVEDELPGLRLARGLGAGELVARTALGDPARAGTVQVAVAVDDVRVPSGVAAGSVVDVYLLRGGSRSSGPTRRGELVLDDVAVLGAGLEEGFAGAGRRKLELAVPAGRAPGFFALVSGDVEAVLAVARQP